MANNFVLNFRAARADAKSKANQTLNNLETPPTRGDMQKARRWRNIAYGLVDTSTLNEGPTAAEERQQQNIPIPKAPSFKYKDPVTDDRIAYWQMFIDEGTMRHYDDLMGILDNIEGMDSKDDIRGYINQLKDTTMYKVNPGIRHWLGDLESQYYGKDMEKYDASYPIELMRYQTNKAKKEFENGHKIEYVQ